MRYPRRLIALGSVLGVLIWMAPGAFAEALDVMTFNLRYAHPAPNSWTERRPVVRALLERQAPDIVGTQEGVHAQITDLEKDLPAYDWVGVGRDGGTNGEYMAIFYRRDRFKPIEHDHFWLSDTPRTAGSRSWGNRLPRMVTWVRLRGPDECELYVVNTHFDHEVQVAREKSAELLLEQVKRFEAEVPVLLLGDFNAAAGASPVYTKLTAPGAFVDTWRELDKPEPPFGTFHDFKGEAHAKETARIDWILARGAARALSTEILTFAQGDQYPSDHFPVVARIDLEDCSLMSQTRSFSGQVSGFRKRSRPDVTAGSGHLAGGGHDDLAGDLRHMRASSIRTEVETDGNEPRSRRKQCETGRLRNILRSEHQAYEHCDTEESDEGSGRHDAQPCRRYALKSGAAQTQPQGDQPAGDDHGEQCQDERRIECQRQP